MSQRSESELTRRGFLRGAITLVCAAPAFGLGRRGAGAAADGPGGARVDGWDVPDATTLLPTEYALLTALFDVLIPGGDGAAGAVEAHAPWYLDQLLGAFDVDPPRIFAGGPYSGRHGGLDGMSAFQPLTRVEAIGWRTYIEGSRGIPEREFNGPVVGLVDRYREGLAALDAAARQAHGTGFALLGRPERKALLLEADGEFVQLAYEHAVEGTYGDPVYGGNCDRRGWRAIDYEGDRQPVGYSASEMSEPREER